MAIAFHRKAGGPAFQKFQPVQHCCVASRLHLTQLFRLGRVAVSLGGGGRRS